MSEDKEVFFAPVDWQSDQRTSLQPEDDGVLSYWMVDPDAPSIVALDLIDGRDVEVGSASGTESITLARPVPVTVTPAALVD